MQEVNWEELWTKEFEYNQKIGRKEPRIECWNKAADDYSDSVTGDNYEYGRKVMESLFHEVINSILRYWKLDLDPERSQYRLQKE